MFDNIYIYFVLINFLKTDNSVMISALDHNQNFTARKWLYREYMIYK